MPTWFSPFCMAGAGVALMMARSVSARIAGALLIVAGLVNRDADLRAMSLYGAIAIIVGILAWFVMRK